MRIDKQIFNSVWKLCFLLMTIIFISSCSSGSSSANSTSGVEPVAIGTLPSGSTVYITNNTVPVEVNGGVTSIISMSGGDANVPYTVSFETPTVNSAHVVTNKVHLAVQNDYGISITTTPEPCIIAVGSTSYPSSCQMHIAVSANTPAGTYMITPVATNQAGDQQKLSPITVLVNGSTVSSAKAIQSFAVKSSTNVVSEGVINGQNIAVTVPYGTDVTNLVAQYATTGASVSVNGVVQIDGTTANNFTKPLQYVVMATDGSTATSTVTVTVAPNTANAITAFSILNSPGTIVGNNIYVTVPFATNTSELIASFSTTGASVKVGNVVQVSDVTPNNFATPVSYTVTAANGATQEYIVNVSVASNSAKAITAYSLNGTPGVIVNQDISVVMPYGTDISSLIATFSTTGESVAVGSTQQISGVTPNSFISPVGYTVTAANGSTQVYTVTVSIAPNTANDMTAFSLNGTSGIITGTNIAVVLPYGTDLTDLTATFTTTGEYVTVANTPQVSGVTPNSFISPVEYTVTAANGNTQVYTVTVSIAPSDVAEIATYSIDGNSGVINGESIVVTLPYGTNISIPMIATFNYTGTKITAKVLNVNVPQVSGVTPNSFISPVNYTVTAADGVTTKQYSVTVLIGAANANFLTSYALRGSTGMLIAGKINQDNGTIVVDMPWHTDPRLMVASFTTGGAKSVTVEYIFTHEESEITVDVPQYSGYSPNCFTSPVIYTVTAPNGSIKQYTVTVNIPEYALSTFSLVKTSNLGYYAGEINQETGAISVKVPYGSGESFAAYWGSDVNLLANPVFVHHTLQIPLVTHNDYTNPVALNVLALPFFVKTYTVTVTHEEPAVNMFTSYSLTVGGLTYPGVIDQQNTPKSITVDIPSNVDVSSAVATFTTGGKATVTVPKVGIPPYTTQVSGVTQNNFSNNKTVVYTVTSGLNANVYNVRVVNPTP